MAVPQDSLAQGEKTEELTELQKCEKKGEEGGATPLTYAGLRGKGGTRERASPLTTVGGVTPLTYVGVRGEGGTGWGGEPSYICCGDSMFSM